VALNQTDITELLALFQQGKFSLVIKKAMPLIKKNRKVPGLHDLAGAAFAETGDLARAERHLREAIRLDSKLDSARHNLANLYFQAGRFDKAATQFREVLKLRPDDPAALQKLGESCLKTGMAVQAANCFQDLAKRDAMNVTAIFCLGTANRALKKQDAARQCFERVLELDADHFDATFNLGNICRDQNRPEEALAFYERAHRLQPDHISTMCNIGLCHVHSHALERGMTWFDRAIAQDPVNPEPRYLKSLPHFLAGDVKAGLAAAEWRLRLPGQIRVLHDGPEPVWDGVASLAEKRLIIHAEQGFGDSIMMSRFVSLLDPAATRITVLVQRGLKGLFDASFPDIEFIEFTDNQTGRLATRVRGDYQCSLMSLAHLTATSWTGLPVFGNYLTAPSKAVAKWADQRGPGGARRIGLVWRGRPTHINDHNRSIGLQHLLRYLQQGPDYVALQKDVTDQERALIDATPALAVETPELEDFADTAGLCSTLDAVLTVDTSVAHLAGALGLPGFVLLPYVPDWRWGLSGQTTGWYPNMTLCRQTAPGAWESVLEVTGMKL
jgi:tetratricopeptide (TPR) repeat protein